MTKLARDNNGTTVQCLGATAATERVAISATNAASSVIPTRTSVVRVIADASCFIRVNTAATDSNAMLLPAGLPEYIKVVPGDKVNVIGTSGFLYITPLT